jgi:heme exporter protein D
MLHWRLLSSLCRVLLVAAALVVAVVIVLGLSGGFSSILTFLAIALVLVTAFLRRRDLNRAIAIQLQREADEELERRQRER